MKSVECMPKMRDKENGMYAQNVGWSMECMPKMIDEEYGM